MKARDFHIGTRIRWAPSAQSLRAASPAGEVRVVHDDLICVVWSDTDRLGICIKRCSVHADDGSPLGEFVPFDPSGPYVHRHYAELAIAVEDAEKLLSGELKQ